eukprot:9167057-Pyramimonas_sp.AAC.1
MLANSPLLMLNSPGGGGVGRDAGVRVALRERQPAPCHPGEQSHSISRARCAVLLPIRRPR